LVTATAAAAPLFLVNRALGRYERQGALPEDISFLGSSALGFSFMGACLLAWGCDPRQCVTPEQLYRFIQDSRVLIGTNRVVVQEGGVRPLFKSEEVDSFPDATVGTEVCAAPPAVFRRLLGTILCDIDDRRELRSEASLRNYFTDFDAYLAFGEAFCEYRILTLQLQLLYEHANYGKVDPDQFALRQQELVEQFDCVEERMNMVLGYDVSKRRKFDYSALDDLPGVRFLDVSHLDLNDYFKII